MEDATFLRDSILVFCFSCNNIHSISTIICLNPSDETQHSLECISTYTGLW